jgi:hypothetical protein
MSMLSWGNMAEKTFFIIQIYTYALNLISSLNPEAIWHSVSLLIISVYIRSSSVVGTPVKIDPGYSLSA